MTSQLPHFRFFAANSWEKDTKNGAAVISVRSLLFRDDFNTTKMNVVFILGFSQEL